MKQFDLQEYLKNPDRKIVTMDGRSARIVCTDGRNEEYPIIALIQCDGGKDVDTYTIGGRDCKGYERPTDLFFVPEKKEGWINIYHHQEGNPEANASRTIYDTKEEALSMRFRFNECVDTIKIKWEE